MTVQFDFIEMLPERSEVKCEQQAAEDCVAVGHVLIASLHQGDKVIFFAEHITEQGRPLGCLPSLRLQKPVEEAAYRRCRTRGRSPAGGWRNLSRRSSRHSSEWAEHKAFQGMRRMSW